MDGMRHIWQNLMTTVNEYSINSAHLGHDLVVCILDSGDFLSLKERNKLMVSTPLENISQNGNLPWVTIKKKKPRRHPPPPAPPPQKLLHPPHACSAIHFDLKKGFHHFSHIVVTTQLFFFWFLILLLVNQHTGNPKRVMWIRNHTGWRKALWWCWLCQCHVERTLRRQI